MAGVIISYKGTVISNLTSTVTRTLETQGTYCEDDITVAYTAPQVEIATNFVANGFKNAVGLISINESGTATSIGNSCFYGCTDLTNVDGFAALTAIGASGFYGCTALTKVDGCASLTNIGSSAFYGCSSLTDLPTEPTVLHY